MIIDCIEMDYKYFKQLRKHYGAIPALRIHLCQSADIDVFVADSHLCELIEENGMGTVERMTSKKLFEYAEQTVHKIKQQEKQQVSQVALRQKRFIQKIFTKQ